LCEGAGDAAFLSHLIKARDLPDFHVTYPAHRNFDEPGGRTGFTARLKALHLVRGFKNVTDLIVISDNDRIPAASFKEVCRLILEAGGYSVPKSPRNIAGNNPRVMVFMLPGEDLPGQLETLCLNSCLDRWPDKVACLDAFISCNPHISTWDMGKQEKMKMRTLIASICSTDPNTSLTHAWSRSEEIIPLEHQCFDGLANFLKSVGGGGVLPL
jgi:hypothetical protein